MMNSFITVYENLKTIVARLCSTLHINEREHLKGRKPTLTNHEWITCAIFGRRQNVGSKKSLYELLEPSCSYNRFVANLKRIGVYLARISAALLCVASAQTHAVKFTDATDIPVCLQKNARKHRTMEG
jgi:hypothetical protein